MLIYVSLLVALLGVLLYAFAAQPKLAEIGRISFAMGILAFLLLIGGHTVGVLGR